MANVDNERAERTAPARGRWSVLIAVDRDRAEHVIDDVFARASHHVTTGGLHILTSTAKYDVVDLLVLGNVD